MSQQPSDKLLDQAALFALGALEGEELQSFTNRLGEGCSLCEVVESFREVAEQLSADVAPVKPRSELRNKLFERVRAESPSSSSKEGATLSTFDVPSNGFTFVEAGQSGWVEAGLGMWMKVLFSDSNQDRMTALVRMDPGCEYAPHRHARAEELYVLEGTCYCGGRLLQPGDYHRAEAGSIHTETSTTDGCFMLVIFSPNNEMLDTVGS